jgi:hypothetical protein
MNTTAPLRLAGLVRLAGLAGRMILAAPLVVTGALTVALSAAVLATALTTFSPLFSTLHRHRERHDPLAPGSPNGSLPTSPTGIRVPQHRKRNAGALQSSAHFP